MDRTATACKVAEMSTSFRFVNIPPELRRLLGKKDPGTRKFHRYGTDEECGEWFDAICEHIPGSTVSPGGVCMFAPVSRSAVNKRVNNGMLTAFCFHVEKRERTLISKVFKPRELPFVYIPVSECKAWAEDLTNRIEARDAAELSEEDAPNDEQVFLNDQKARREAAKSKRMERKK